jgi:ketosteroid isomerase-like protein
VSEENVRAVRRPVAVKPSTRRRLEERLGLRFPWLVPPFARAVWRLSVRSRLRQALIGRFVRFVFEAINRKDYEAALLLYHPQGETTYVPQVAGLGGEARTVGLEARLRFQERWEEEWGGFRIEPQEIITLGDRLVVLVQVEGTGLSSGAAASAEGGFVFTMSEGRAIREQVFLGRRETLEAAGLS